MILNEIVIENIRSCRAVTIEFPRGTTLIQGDMGTGKSTVLMAVEFALLKTTAQ